ncbi:sodium:solute symporter [Arachidicoccus ginsenosidimutans]|uniref:sodium:solute symporter n=1 Tax=Arachidicoccus sp. BS20 TaxID=1850526 RepID=UPI0007F06FB9|nr:sodium:solute symporter [Arachidicoccus sp. BS20]ANI87912.1 sodium:solute symporter [Arachidicoccus sp. BS20]
MSGIDWIVMMLTLTVMLLYGVLVGRKQRNSQSYLKGDNQMRWYMVLFGVMATQASAITFIAEPGQAYTDGMRFVQYYFGMPLAMIVICVTFIPIFQKLNVYTAYEYLAQRFDKRTRVLTSLLFLLSRGLSTGISIYAPSIILSSILHWNIYLTNVLMGGILLIYTYIGGAKAVAHTQKWQFLIILATMSFAGFLVVKNMPHGTSFGDALYLAGKSGKLNVINTKFDLKDKYNIWSGLIGGFFLALSYFGTDQSQVGRYISAKDTTNSRMGLLLNGLVKIPMQFGILLIGALIFALFSMKPAPMTFNNDAWQALQKHSPKEAAMLETQHTQLEKQLQNESAVLLQQRHSGASAISKNEAIQSFRNTQAKLNALHTKTQTAINSASLTPEDNDTNYIFLYFVKNNLPVGLIGLLFAAIFLANWGSTSAALHSLAVSSLVDVQEQLSKEKPDETMRLKYGKLHTLLWGIFCILVAFLASKMGSLIEAVNVLGSIFYGTILGIFLVAFYIKKINTKVVFGSIILTQILVVVIYFLNIISFLWLNVIGAAAVVLFAIAGTALWRKQ